MEVRNWPSYCLGILKYKGCVCVFHLGTQNIGVGIEEAPLPGSI